MKKNKIKLFKIYSILILLGIVLFLILSNLVKYFFIYYDVKKTYEDLNLKIKKEEEKKVEIKKEAKRYENNFELERKILEDNMLQRPGEKVIELID